MLAQLKRHPIPIRAHFGHSVVLTYAVQPCALSGLLPSGLQLDEYKGHALLAVAMVQTHRLRPAGLPALFGQDFFLVGYRIFVKYRDSSGRTLRGLRILRSYADGRLMVHAGNLFTHYNYHLASVEFHDLGQALRLITTTPDHEADLEVEVDLSAEAAELPVGSPFASLHDARRFAGPLPYTFDHEPATHSIIIIEGRRENWNPRPVTVRVHRNTFVDQFATPGHRPVLANAFHVRDVDYRWLRGRREVLGGTSS